MCFSFIRRNKTLELRICFDLHLLYRQNIKAADREEYVVIPLKLTSVLIYAKKTSTYNHKKYLYDVVLAMVSDHVVTKNKALPGW